MYLKSIRIYGFKSFADKTDIDLTKGVIGIVGPNGSGKSNIVDAVKWVLGESSTKNLRANNKMTDVIFSGSKTREAQTRASVSLTFDNEDNYLNYDFKELEIKRVLFNSGENEYYLNGSKVRLKDITDLFIDSGASKETFNIISQGKIQDVVNANPEGRRVIFEEAAGVLKYKKRKEESLRKLEKTLDNLSRINLIINELSTTVEPLKAQSEVAKKFLEYKSELEGIEIGLLASDITEINTTREKLNNDKDAIESRILIIEATNKKDTGNTEKLKLQSIKLDEKINTLNENILALTDEVSKLESEKQIALERKKYQVEDIKLTNNIVNLKEEELTLKNTISTIKKDLEILEKEAEKLSNTVNNTLTELKNTKDKRNILLTDYTDNNKLVNDYKNKIAILEANLANDTSISYAARNVLNNPRLKGIHNVLIKLLNVDANYSVAITTALGFNQNVIVVDNETSAKEAIGYLKENNLGRATFFPLNVIKPRYIEEDVLSRIKQVDGYIGIASSLVSYSDTYNNIVLNQLGNVIVVKNIDTLNLIGKIVNYRYRVVSLDGELLNTGGSITGGKNKENQNLLRDKQDLITYQSSLDKKMEIIKNIELDLKNVNSEINILDDKYSDLQRELTVVNEKINSKKDYLVSQEKILNNKSSELKGTKNIQNNALDEEINKVLETLYEHQEQKTLKEKELISLKKEKFDLSLTIEKEEKENKEFNAEYNHLQSNLKEIEVSLAKLDVKLDNLLVNLSENYQMTYEKAKEEHVLELESDIARMKVNSLKHEIKSLGEVNLGSISEYERLSKRYNYLTSQSEDLTTSVSDLKEVITEMDGIMVERFRTTFDKVNEEFKNVYKILFKGGTGKLELTDKDNILTTGIEIIASPPGKKLNSIGLLSGGEKALTSLALLFAILNVKPTPFCIMDEVEDALDEANVDVFGKYINSIKNKTQFIIITHKKRTMEYSDVLYGITMQESGVSKLVSVKLDNI